jgi:hypothetical protein
MDRITELENENRWLKEEVRRLRHQLAMNDEKKWAHPNSCVHNPDPWKTWKFK